MASADSLTVERLRELLDYDPTTGIFTWRAATNAAVRGGRENKSGLEAGSNDNGYIRIRVDGRLYKAHRLAWFHHYGRWPKGMLDHRDTVRSHNWIDNLREATHGTNAKNASTRKDNSSGVKGVSRDGSRWRVQISVDGRVTTIGRFDQLSEAKTAYAAASAKYHGEYGRTS